MKCALAVMVLTGSIMCSPVLAHAWHGGWHPSTDRLPPSGQGPLLPDPNIPYYQDQQQRAYEHRQQQLDSLQPYVSQPSPPPEGDPHACFTVGNAIICR